MGDSRYRPSVNPGPPPAPPSPGQEGFDPATYSAWLRHPEICGVSHDGCQYVGHARDGVWFCNKCGNAGTYER